MKNHSERILLAQLYTYSWNIFLNPENQTEKYLGKGHFPLSRSSSTYFLTTSWHRCNNDITATFVIEPSSE